MKRKNPKSVFPDPSYDEMKPMEQPNIDDFKLDSLDDLNWCSFGKWLIDVYQHFQSKDDMSAVAYTFPIEALLVEKLVKTEETVSETVHNTKDEDKDNVENVEMEVGDENAEPNEKQENSDSNGENSKLGNTTGDPQCTNSAEASADDSDAKDTNSGETSSKTKQGRRRGSDLKFLEQWCFWDRNRKYSQRQKNKMEKIEVDRTINGFLRKILSSHFE